MIYPRRALVLLVASVSMLPGGLHAQDLSPERAGEVSGVVFKAGVDVVTLSATVRDESGQVVRDLQRADFEVLDTGIARGVRDFHSGDAPISLGVLLDISGSMAVGGNIDRARSAVGVAMGMLNGPDDEAALYTFDATLQEVVAFTKSLDVVRRVSLDGEPWGTTSLYDAIGAAARHVAERANRHRALLVITDGIDTASRFSAADVSGVASAIDVPVYVLTVVTPLDRRGGERARLAVDRMRSDVGTLADLSRWTGGDMKVVSAPDDTVEAMRMLFAELRYQYLITFESGAAPGWHPLEVRTHNDTLTVHARSGYISGPSPSDR
jgi:VWFA-related protein